MQAILSPLPFIIGLGWLGRGLAARRSFFVKRGLKKNKIRKRGASWRNLEKWCLPPAERAESSLPPNHRAGCSKKISRDLFANKKTFFIREEIPEAGFSPGQWAGCLPPRCTAISCVCVFWIPKFVTIHRKIQK
jgi:hypothetical protein